MQMHNEGMEEIINSLLAEDAGAQQKLYECQQRRQQMADAMAKVKEDLQRDNYERAQNRVEKIRQQHRAEYDEEMIRLQASYEAALHDLRHNYEEHRAQWVSTLVARCLG